MQKRECVDKDLTRKPNILNQNHHTYFQGSAAHTFKGNICMQKELESLTFANP